MRKLQKGFTLIELLVVIAIIAILASVVLLNVSAARGKARIAALKSVAGQIKTQQELFADNNSGNYAVVSTEPDAEFEKIRKAITDQGGAIIGSTGGSSTWMVAIDFPDNSQIQEKAFCVDSSGNTKSYTTAPASATGPTCP